jgi:hypothetical protein
MQRPTLFVRAKRFWGKGSWEKPFLFLFFSFSLFSFFFFFLTLIIAFAPILSALTTGLHFHSTVWKSIVRFILLLDAMQKMHGWVEDG